MMGGAWRVAVMGLAVAGAALAFLGSEVVRLAGAEPGTYVQDVAVAGVGLIALWAAFGRLNRHFREQARRRDQAVAVPWRSERAPPGRWEKGLSAMLGLTDEPFLLLDELGRVDRLNAAAARLLETEEGADIGRSLVRDDLARAIERARGNGDAVPAVLRRPDDTELSARVVDLGLNAGVVVTFPVRNAGSAAASDGKRTLTLRPAGPPAPLGDDEPLAALPFVALWVATGSLDGSLEEGPVVAVGTVRLVGARVFRTVSLSLLVDPAVPVAAEATARHGITTAMVAGERPFAEVWPAIEGALHHCVVVGVGVDASLAILARACAQANLAPPVLPPRFDLGKLAAALDPALAGASLDRLAAAFGVEGGSPDDPFAPALLQAELAAALMVRLDRQGIATQGQARALLAG